MFRGVKLGQNPLFIILGYVPPYRFASQKSISHHLKVLNLKPGYTSIQLKAAYLQMVKKHHPDLSTLPNAKQKFLEVQEAYDALQDVKDMRKQEVEEEEKKQNREEEGENGKESAEKFRKKFYDNYSKKRNVDESMQFSYGLYKKHHEEIQVKKAEYKKYYGHDREIWARKDEKGEPIWNTLGLATLIVGLLVGSVYIVNWK